MPLGDIASMVKTRLMFLADDATADGKIASRLTEAFYLFQECMEKIDAEVEDESKYTNLQKIFFADYVAYVYLRDEIIRNAGSARTEAATIKRAKADVVEVEYMTGKEREGLGLIKKANEISAELLSSLCATAKKINCCPAICSQIAGDGSHISPPMIYVETYNID